MALDADGKPTPALLKKLPALGADASAVPRAQARAWTARPKRCSTTARATGATLAEGLQKALDESARQAADPEGHELPARRRLDRRAVRAPGARPGRAARQRGRAGRGARACRPAAPRTAIASRPRRRRSRCATPTATRAQLRERGRGDRRLRRSAAPRSRASSRRGRARSAAARADRRRRAARRSHRAGRTAERAARASSSDEFLDVPQECLILTMKANQKYFPLLDADGKLTQRASWSSATSRPTTRARVDRRQRARGAPAPGRRQVLLRPGPQEDAGSRACRRWPRSSITTSWARRASASSACARIAAAIGAQLGGDALAAGRPRRAAGQGRPADRHGRRVPRAAGHHGRATTRATTASRGSRAAAIEDHYQPRFAGDALPRNDVGTRGRAGRQARDAGRHVRHRPAADRRQGPVRAAPPCAGRAAHAGREATCRCRCRDLLARRRRAVRRQRRRQGPARRASATSSTTACAASCASRATARRRSTRCWRCARSAWATSPSAWRPCAPSPRCPKRRAGRGQQAHRQHPEEGRGSADAARRASAAAGSRPSRRCTRRMQQRRAAGRRAVRRAATTPARCRRWPRCAAPVDAFFDDVMVMAEDADLRANRLPAGHAARRR